MLIIWTIAPYLESVLVDILVSFGGILGCQPLGARIFRLPEQPFWSPWANHVGYTP